MLVFIYVFFYWAVIAHSSLITVCFQKSIILGENVGTMKCIPFFIYFHFLNRNWGRHYNISEGEDVE